VPLIAANGKLLQTNRFLSNEINQSILVDEGVTVGCVFTPCLKRLKDDPRTNAMFVIQQQQ
jgi:hypothetical protein